MIKLPEQQKKRFKSLTGKAIKKGRIQVFDPTSTYEKHALWEGMTNIDIKLSSPKKIKKKCFNFY